MDVFDDIYVNQALNSTHIVLLETTTTKFHFYDVIVFTWEMHVEEISYAVLLFGSLFASHMLHGSMNNT